MTSSSRRMNPLARAALVGLWLASAGCELSQPSVGRVIDGGPVPIARASFDLRVRHTERLPVEVFFPSDSEGHPTLSEDGGRRRALVLIQGGLVSTSRYHWLAERLARRGWVVAVPAHTGDLALLSIDNGRFARELLVSPPAGSALEGLVDPQRIGVAGHSLGGVVATKLALGGGFGALALLASYPDSADAPRLPSLGMPSLVLAGALDCSAPLDKVRELNEALPSPSLFATLQGVTHYQFTSSQREDEQRDCLPVTELEAAHERMTEVLDRFFRAALDTGRAEAELLRDVPGLEVSAR